MPRVISIWLTGTIATLALLAMVASLRDDQLAWRAMGWGIGVSLVTLLACRVTLAAWDAQGIPLRRQLIETNLRLVLPLSFLFAMAIARPNSVNETFLLYFVPFQFVTLISGSAAAIREANAKP